MAIIQRATANDAGRITQLARSIYREHYLHLWHPGGADWYMNEFAYAQDKTLQELSDPHIEYYLVLENGMDLGYLKLVLSAATEGFAMDDALEVERIYLHRASMGKGTGKQLMELALRRAKELGRRTVFLKAMDSSKEAIGFYERSGFEVCGRLQLPLPEFVLMKEEYRGMVIMKRSVDGFNNRSGHEN